MCGTAVQSASTTTGPTTNQYAGRPRGSSRWPVPLLPPWHAPVLHRNLQSQMGAARRGTAVVHDMGIWYVVRFLLASSSLPSPLLRTPCAAMAAHYLHSIAQRRREAAQLSKVSLSGDAHRLRGAGATRCARNICTGRSIHMILSGQFARPHLTRTDLLQPSKQCAYTVGPRPRSRTRYLFSATEILERELVNAATLRYACALVSDRYNTGGSLPGPQPCETFTTHRHSFTKVGHRPKHRTPMAKPASPYIIILYRGL